MGTSNPRTNPTATERTLSGHALIEPMEAKLVEALPDGRGWQFEPKWDGDFRCVVHKSGGAVDLRARSGKPLGRYFPEMLDAVRGLLDNDLVLDGELAIPTGDTLSFDALQMRLHPAESRVRKLARETPAILILFDQLRHARSGDVMQLPLSRRREALEGFFAGLRQPSRFRLSPMTAALHLPADRARGTSGKARPSTACGWMSAPRSRS